MVHGFKIENDKLILDVEEILQYPLLQQIYARDDSKDKSFAEKEFRFILYLSDRKGYVIIRTLEWDDEISWYKEIEKSVKIK